MAHIRKLDEVFNANNAITKTEYVITNCEVSVAEDNYENGETNDSGFINYEVNKRVQSDTLEGLLKKFLEIECDGHTFDINEWVYDPENPNRLEIPLLGKPITNDYIIFKEPSEQDMEDFRNNSINLSAFVFNLYIEKREVTDDLIADFEELGIESM